MKFFRSKLVLFTLAIILAACILMISAYATGKPSVISNLMGAVVTPLEHGVSRVSDFFSGIFGYFYRYSALEEENARLKAQLAEYQKQEALYGQAIAENEQLRDLVKINRRHADFVCEPSSVVAISDSGFRSGFTIDKGSLAGIESGDCVITDAGFVGYVTEVGLSYAEVVTLVDISVKIGAVVSRTREVVVAEGNFNLVEEGRFRLSYLSNDSDIKVGDLVETSGYGNMYPKGLLLGKVVAVLPEDHGISSYAVVEPVVDLSGLKSVFVVKEFHVSD